MILRTCGVGVPGLLGLQSADRPVWAGSVSVAGRPRYSPLPGHRGSPASHGVRQCLWNNPGIACATSGLVLASLVGGPIASPADSWQQASPQSAARVIRRDVIGGDGRVRFSYISLLRTLSG